MSEKEKDEEAFFSDSFSLFFNPRQFVLDFKQSVPKIEDSEEEHEHKTVQWHKPVLLNPVLAKKLLKVLEKNIKKYEEKFEEIEIREMETEPKETSDEEEPSYIG